MTTLTLPVTSLTMGDEQPNILDRAKVAALLGFTVGTVDTYRIRYRGTDTPFPEPDGHFGHSPYWRASRTEELKAWAASRQRPGRPRKQV